MLEVTEGWIRIAQWCSPSRRPAARSAWRWSGRIVWKDCFFTRNLWRAFVNVDCSCGKSLNPFIFSEQSQNKYIYVLVLTEKYKVLFTKNNVLNFYSTSYEINKAVLFKVSSLLWFAKHNQVIISLKDNLLKIYICYILIGTLCFHTFKNTMRNVKFLSFIDSSIKRVQL